MKSLTFPEVGAFSTKTDEALGARFGVPSDDFAFKPAVQGAKAVAMSDGAILGAAVSRAPMQSGDAKIFIETVDSAIVQAGAELSTAVAEDISGDGPEGDVAASVVIEENWTDDELFQGLEDWFYLSPTFADLDGDGDMDMVVGMWMGAVVALRNGTERTSGEFQHWDGADPFAAVNVYSMATPCMTDLEGDGDMDLVVGNGYGQIFVYRNGTIFDSGDYVGQDGEYPFAQFDGEDGLDISFVDLDGDGDDDMVTGDGTGALVSYRNGTDGERGSYVAWGRDDPFGNVSVEAGSTPAFIDMDADGDLDCVTGTRDGEFLVFRNGGRGTSGEFREWKTGNPFEGFSVSLRADPAFADIDGDGDLDFVTGSYDFTLYAFENIARPGAKPKFDFDSALMEVDTAALVDTEALLF